MIRGACQDGSHADQDGTDTDRDFDDGEDSEEDSIIGLSVSLALVVVAIIMYIIKNLLSKLNIHIPFLHPCTRDPDENMPGDNVHVNDIQLNPILGDSTGNNVNSTTPFEVLKLIGRRLHTREYTPKALTSFGGTTSQSMCVSKAVSRSGELPWQPHTSSSTKPKRVVESENAMYVPSSSKLPHPVHT